MSTSKGSLAILDDARIKATIEWGDTRIGRQGLFPALHSLTQDGVLDLAAVDLIAVGVGPGAFSGLRMAVSAACAMAMPDRRPVFALSSAEALAWEVFQEKRGASLSKVFVAGDARRDEIWVGQFALENGIPKRIGDWDLVACGVRWSGTEGPPGVWVTPDWERIGLRLLETAPAGHEVVTQSRIPSATAVAELAVHKRAAGLASCPLAPIYIHGPVHAPATTGPA